MSEANKPHLWIPEEEVTDIPKEPTGRSNKYDIQYNEHGAKLSKGLQEVLSFFQRLQQSESITEDDLITFKVILQDKEDFAEKKKFIEDEGLKINAVKNKNTAVVSAPRDAFSNLQGRVDRYRDKGIKKDFQYIAGFEPFTAEDKQAASLLEYFKEHPDALAVDVQVMILPEVGPDVQEKYKNRVVKKIARYDGKLQDDPYHLTDGTPVIRAIVPSQNVDELSDDPGVYRVEMTSFFHFIAPSASSPFTKNLQLEPGFDVDALPTVVVLDDGVSFPKGLSAVVPVHWMAKGCKKTKMFAGHGTPVASRAAFENLGYQMSQDHLTPRAKIIDALIVDAESTPGNVMLKRIREAVENFSSVAKIFNFSYNAKVHIDGTEMSIIGCEMDMLCRKYGIRFVVSAGNHKLYLVEDSLKDIIDDDDTQIAEPADAMLAVTVGAIVGQTHPGSVSKENDIAPYSRRGPGFFGFYKPDLVAYGATQFKNGLWPNDPYGLCLSPTGYCTLPGTSFTAPTVAGDLAQVLSTVPNDDIGLAQALLYNGAIPVYDREGMSQEEMDLAGNLYGRGLSSPENSMFSSEDKMTFLHTGTLNRLTKKRVKFHVPSSIAKMKLKKGASKIRVTVTCIAQPPVDRTKGEEYSSAYIYTSMHRKNSNGNLVCDNPSVSNNRNKWDTCYHFYKDYSSFDAGNWEVWLELFTRWGVKDDDEIPYSLVITVEDLTAAGNMYSETIKETAGRFKPVQPIRVSVR